MNLVLVVYTTHTMSIQFVLSAFESSVQMGVAGTIATSSIPAITTDATAVLQVSVEDMKNVFKYQTDSTDLTDANSDDIKYYVHPDAFPLLNPANAMMDAPDSLNPIATANSDGDLPANKMLVAHDFVRYLALKLFNTHYGVDLFNNEVALLQDLRTICSETGDGHTWKVIKDKLDTVGIAGSHGTIATDANGDKYMTNEETGDDNLCRVLMQQMLGAASSRFAQIDTEAADGKQSLPFLANDSISFKLTISAAQDQELLTGVAAIPDRSYEIKLLLVDGTAENTEVDAAEAEA